MKWTNAKRAGYLPTFLSEHSDLSMVDQIHISYGHGGGWQDFEGLSLNGDTKNGFWLGYPGDPAMQEVARCESPTELLILFTYDWVCVRQKSDGSYRIARID